MHAAGDRNPVCNFAPPHAMVVLRRQPVEGCGHDAASGQALCRCPRLLAAVAQTPAVMRSFSLALACLQVPFNSGHLAIEPLPVRMAVLTNLQVGALLRAGHGTHNSVVDRKAGAVSQAMPRGNMNPSAARLTAVAAANW